ncbi:hypothetical protein AVEN_241355-1 [Araneus ventricosus]|uniref:Uncharacterized protein n=1 Tax=Araneus ventricosus TaxID=182803 RepID=A0A4Y2IDV5_ARAVE|nr:hypothetical protein AVEN_241355-1 [Araneus ventricosus]
MEFDSHYSKCEHKLLQFKLVPINRLDIQRYFFYLQKDMEKIPDGHLFAIFMGTDSIKAGASNLKAQQPPAARRWEKHTSFLFSYSIQNYTKESLPIRRH